MTPRWARRVGTTGDLSQIAGPWIRSLGDPVAGGPTDFPCVSRGTTPVWVVNDVLTRRFMGKPTSALDGRLDARCTVRTTVARNLTPRVVIPNMSTGGNGTQAGRYALHAPVHGGDPYMTDGALVARIDWQCPARQGMAVPDRPDAKSSQ